jgi:hypothetical protein
MKLTPQSAPLTDSVQSYRGSSGWAAQALACWLRGGAKQLDSETERLPNLEGADECVKKVAYLAVKGMLADIELFRGFVVMAKRISGKMQEKDRVVLSIMRWERKRREEGRKVAGAEGRSF